MASEKLTAAAVQMVSSADLAGNLEVAGRLCEQAAGQGAQLVVLPEYFAFMGMKEVDKYPIVEEMGVGPIQDFLATTAQSHGIWLVGGTIPIASDEPDRPWGRCLVYSPDGEYVSHFDKVHMFDVQVADNKGSYVESRNSKPGQNIAVVSTPWAEVGLSVCYDLRFPELYRAEVDQGASCFVVPAAFTAKTGEAHWDLLLRTRAVENQCYLIASAQGGVHQNGRRTWGRSCIVDPWGKVIACHEEGEGIATGTMDFGWLAQLREEFPVLSHRVMG